MTLGEHSPGPWHVEPLQRDHGESIAITSERDGVVAIIHPLCEDTYPGLALRAATDYPNAYLMAAAPEMLAALQDAEQELVELLEDLCDEPEEDISAHRTLTTIRAAIAKAGR